MKKYLVFLMAALMLVALAVAGCGGSDKQEAGTKAGRRHERPLLYFRLDCNG